MTEPVSRLRSPVRLSMLGAMLITLAGVAGCSTYKKTGGSGLSETQLLESRAQEAIEAFKEEDPSMSRFFESAHAYVVFPKVAKGGAGIGGARGRGVTYRDGKVTGYSTLTQGSLGFQLGGQVYREIIFFRTPRSYEQFTKGNLEFSAQASAVAATAGASADADYEEGVAIFTMERGGLMYEASIGGQKFSFTPKLSGNANESPERPPHP